MPKDKFWLGVKTELPIALGVIPFGIIYGVLALKAGLSPWMAQGMSSIVFAGSAQFIATELFALQSPVLILLITTFIVNLRHMLYSADVAPRLQQLRPLWRWGLAYLLTDEAYVVSAIHYNDDTQPAANKHWFFLGAGLTLWVWWQISTAIGILVGTQLPDSWSLEFTLILTFIGLVIPNFFNTASVAAAVSAGLVAMLTLNWPFRLGLMAAALTGIIVGIVWQQAFTKETASSKENPS